MMNETGLRRVLPDQLSGSGHTFGTPRHPSVIDPILSKRVCFYKSGDPQFNGLRMVINNRTFKTFDALLDSLSKKVPLPFGVRNITTPRGVHAINTLDELEDGKSYICSDSRKVKPINLSLARKKLPPWYHARPVSSRRQTVQQARFFPGRKIHKQEPMLMRTPKRLLVFRNGEPTVQHTVVLHKRTTPTFESILEYISELLQFHVGKLHTPDGRRVDGLPALILCSGTVVAAGREPFKPANYSAHKSPAPTTVSSKRMGIRRLKALNRKRKSLSHTSRKFSPSSERYIVNQIHSSIAESSCDLPSQPTNSVELGSARMLESVAETEGESLLCDGAGGLPTEDDIEKSFRVNQDGSMTVEMRVRLTIKEEETVHWTTTLTRSSVASQLNAAALPEAEEEPEISSLKSDSLDLHSSAASIDTINKDRTEDNNDEDPPSLSNGAFSESGNEEDYIKAQMDMTSPWRAPTPEQERIRNKQASVENLKSVMGDGIQEGMVGSYSYREQYGAMTEQYCVMKQSTTRPVPKPRSFGSVEANNTNSRNISTFKSVGMTEILQADSSGEEVTETVLHIYEQQTCQDNFLANVCGQGLSASGIPFGRPATSEIAQLCSNNESEPELWRPSTASESVSIWRAESMSVTSDLTLPSLTAAVIQAGNTHQRFQEPRKSNNAPKQTEVSKDRKVSPKAKVTNKRARRLMSPAKKQKENSADATKNVKKRKTFSSAGFIKKIYGKPAKSVTRLKKGQPQNGDSDVSTKSSKQSDDTNFIPTDPNIPSALKETSEAVSLEKSRLNISSTEAGQTRGILTRQTSVHQEKTDKNKSHDVSESVSLPTFNPSSSVTNEYVENWLEKAHPNPAAFPSEDSKKSEAVIPVQTEDGGKCLEEKSEIQTCQTLKTDPVLQNMHRASVKQRIKSFENKLSSPSVEKTTVNRQIGNSQTTAENTENYSSEIIPPHIDTSTETSGSDAENKSNPVKILIQKATPFSTLSMEFPPPPPPAEIPELSNAESCMMDESSAASSPLYRLSSVSSQMSDNQPLSISSTSDKAESPTDHTMEMTTSIQTDIPSMLEEAPLPRSPSIKRHPLVSNTSLDRKMSLRKACLDKYTLCSAATSDTSSAAINTVGDNTLPNGICPTGTQQPGETPPEGAQESNSILDMNNSLPCCSSASPTSSTSEERMSSASFSSSEDPAASDRPFKEANITKTPFLTQETPSPKPSIKKIKHLRTPSPERKPQTKKLSSELPQNSPKLSPLLNHPPDKTTSPSIAVRRNATPTVSPSADRKQPQYTPKLQKRTSPYSQSLDMASPPVRHKASRKLPSRNLSSDNASEAPSKMQRKTSSERKKQQTPQSTRPETDLEKPPSCNPPELLDVDQDADQEKSTTETQPMLQPLNITNQPNMKPVLEEICYSIKSIRQITQNKRPSCLEKSNSLPDFSSHVASTFGSSSKALLAFLSVMTLKEGITNLNMDELSANNVSCAEALRMIDSLREIASIEDSHSLKASLSNLQQSASKQLLESWRGFSDKCRSRSSTPNHPEQEMSKRGCDENVIDEIMENLDIPEELKVELASLSEGVKSDSDDEENTSAGIIKHLGLSLKDTPDAAISHESTEDADNVRDGAQDEKTNVDVSSIIKKFTDISQPKESSTDTAKQKPNTIQMAKYPPAEPQSDEKQIHSDESLSVSEKELSHDEESGSDKEGQTMSAAYEDLKHKESSSDQSASGSEAGELHSSEEEPEVEREVIQQDGRESDDSSIPTSHSEEEEDEQAGSNNYVEVNVRQERLSSPDCRNRSSSEEEQQEDEYKELSNKGALSKPASPSNSEEEQQSQAGSLGRADESNSDVDEPPSEDDQPEVERKELKVIAEESLSGNEEEHESIEEEEHLDDLAEDGEQREKCRELKALIEEEEEEDKVSLDDEDNYDETLICDETKSRNTVKGDLIENGDLCTKKDSGTLIKSDSLSKSDRFSADEDSGNDHSSCEEHVDADQPQAAREKISGSVDELSYYEKESSAEEEHANIDRYMEESCAEYEEVSALAVQPEVTECGQTVEKLKLPSEEIITQSVAERVLLLERQAAEAQSRKNTREHSPSRRFSQRNVPLESDAEDPPSHGTQSAPHSSLSFSYDSTGIITTEPEGNRVRSIREMFLAKIAPDAQQGHRSPNASQLSELRAETSASGGYQSQTSSELSSGEDDSARKSITKGFVRRTIERLYGKKETNEEVCERPPSAPKDKKKEHSNIFSPFHIAKAMSELSYFNSTNALDTLSEATRCVAFNAQVGPGDSVPIDNGRWLLRENTVIRKSVSDPVGINKTFTNSPQSEEMCEDTEESTPYSLFSTKSDLEDKKQSLSRKCTYFSLPHASDSDACQDDLSTASKSSVNGDSTTDAKDKPEDTKTRADRNGTLPRVGVTDFKMMDNKVHPLVELPPDGEVVVMQPGKGQGVMNRRLQEPDMLDLLYNFCGQNCPIL